MALTAELLKGSEALKGLTDDQIAKLVELSKKDEDIFINQKQSEWWDRIHNDVFELTGEKKEGGERSYDYLKEQWKKTIEKVKETEKGLTSKEEKIKELQKQIESGKGDEAMKAELEKVREDYKQALNKLDTQKKHFEGEIQKATEERDSFQKQITDSIVRSSFKGGYQRGKDVDETVFDAVLESSIQKVLGQFEPVIVDAAKGLIHWKDKDGKIQYDPKNDLNPKSGVDLLLEQPGFQKVVEIGKKQTGTGGPSGAGGGVEVVDIGAAKTQIQADKIINKAAADKGLKFGTDAYIKYVNDQWTENNVAKLPRDEEN